LLKDLPNNSAKTLPRYPTVPVIRIERLAIDVKYKELGAGLGAALLADGLIAHPVLK